MKIMYLKISLFKVIKIIRTLLIRIITRTKNILGLKYAFYFLKVVILFVRFCYCISYGKRKADN